MSSSVASIGEHTAQQNFNPSWMRSTFHGGSGGGGIGSTPRASANDESHDDYPMSEPVLSDFRYGRDDLLALVPKDSNPPDGLAECPFFVEIAQLPIVNNPLNDLEQRLQHNINSSKAMSSLSHAERASIAAGGVYGGGYSSTTNGQSPGAQATKTPVGGGWTVQRQTSWTKNSTPERPQRGGASVRGAGSFYSRGGGTTNGSVSSTPDESYAKFSSLRRGGGPGAVGRGGSTTAYNSRAEKLYNKDERPRGVGVSRSGSDEENDDQGGGWETVGAKNTQNGEKTRPAWGRSESWSNRSNENSNSGGAWNRNEKANGNRDNANVWKDRQQMLESLQDAPDDNDVSTATPLTDAATTATESNNSLQATVSDSVATTSESYASQIHETTQQQQQQPQPFPSVWPNPVISGLPNMFDLERMRLAQLQQQQQLAAQIAAQQQVAQAAAAAAEAAAAAAAKAKKEPVDFYYLDPSETVRGPFPKDQMIAWFKAGYFSEESLRVRRDTDSQYLTIGQLLQQNGKTTPFDYPDEKEPLRTSPTQALSQFSMTQPTPNSFANFNAPNMWANAPLDVLVQSALEKQLAAERQRLIDEYSRRAQEEAEKFKKVQEALVRQMNMHHEMTREQLREQELGLQRQSEELLRRETEMKEHALELQKKLEEQHNQLNEKQRAINEEVSRKAAEEQARKEREAALARKLAEEEERRKKAEQAAEFEKQRLAKEAEIAAERIRQLSIQKKAESDAAARKKHEEEDRRIAEELSKKQQQQQFEIEQSFEKAAKPKQISPSGSDDSESGWTSVAKSHTKPAPWAAAKTETVKEKTLREIQMEEERQAKAEAERLANLRKEEQKEQMSLQAAGTWGGASARLQWTGNANGTASPPVRPKNAGPVWTTPQEPSRSSYVAPMFDGPSLEAANRIQPVKKVQSVAAKPSAAVAPKKATVAPTPKPQAEQKSKQQQASEQMCNWFAKRFKQLASNSDEVDTSMLFSFVMDLENPNEVEDIVMSYLDESKSVKEFVREFLKRRIELRANNNKSDHDDLSSARAVSAAPSDSNAGSMGGSGGSGVQGKKKKKNQRMVLDGNILGFRGAAASDRLNKGEIDAIPTAPVNPSRR